MSPDLSSVALRPRRIVVALTAAVVAVAFAARVVAQPAPAGEAVFARRRI
jgi:hypothetical protein